MTDDPGGGERAMVGDSFLYLRLVAFLVNAEALIHAFLASKRAKELLDRLEHDAN